MCRANRRGVWYKLNMTIKGSKGIRACHPHELEDQIAWILEDAARNPARPGEDAIAALTGWNRTRWAQVCVCVCACLRAREGGREGESERERERGRHRAAGLRCVLVGGGREQGEVCAWVFLWVGGWGGWSREMCVCVFVCGWLGGSGTGRKSSSGLPHGLAPHPMGPRCVRENLSV